ncbi:MAG: metallophosphoesterase [Oscillospiraceae bacterium]|nr:metallophosphoesterase [Oscillospiraceae bacterium]
MTSNSNRGKALWHCYAITFLLYTVVFLWGITGLFGGGGLTYHLFTLYAILPGVTGLGGIALGIKGAHMKWLYPPLFGAIARIMPHIIFQRPFVLLPSFVYFLAPFLAASIGVGVGVLIRTLRARLKDRHKRKIRIAWRVLMIIGAVIALIHALHALTLDRIIEYREVPFASPQLSPELNGYRIAFITDTHAISEARLWGIVDELNQQSLDLLLLGGDFAEDIPHMQRTLAILSHIEATDGIFGVDGNHDNHRRLFPAMEAQGMTPLPNRGQRLRGNLFLAGVEDLTNRSPNIAQATRNARPADFVLLLSHSPDIAMRQDTSGIDLILSGHTHGGQMTFFGLWAPYFTLRRTITHYGQRFRSGWAHSQDGTPVFVSNGTGEYFPRIFARPQVILITLAHEA